MAAAGRFRFANELRAWIDVEDGAIVDSGYAGGGHIAQTKMNLAVTEITLEATPFPDLRADPEVGDGWVKFVQTAGGRTGAPAPRTVKHPPFVKIEAPSAWTTLALTIHADGRRRARAARREPVPAPLDLRRRPQARREDRPHRVQGLVPQGVRQALAVGQRGLAGVRDRGRDRARARALGHDDAPGRVAEVQEARRRARRSCEQGDEGRELFLLLDGVLAVEVDGEVVAELGPGAVLGERALLEGGKRTSTLRAVTKCRVAIAEPDDIAPEALDELRGGHRREHEA